MRAASRHTNRVKVARGTPKDFKLNHYPNGAARMRTPEEPAHALTRLQAPTPDASSGLEKIPVLLCLDPHG
jgi:hypothetical protein